MLFVYRVATRYMRSRRADGRNKYLRWITLLLILATLGIFVADALWVEKGIRLFLTPASQKIREALMLAKYISATVTLLVALLIECLIWLSPFATVVTFGLTLGIGSMLVTHSLQTALLESFQRNVVGFHSAMCIVPADKFYISDYQKVLDKMKQIRGVVSAAPYLNADMLLMSDTDEYSSLDQAEIRGVVVADTLQSTAMKTMMTQGELEHLITPPRLSEDGRITKMLPGIVLGAEMAMYLGAPVGSVVRVLSPFGEIAPTGVIPSVRRFRVVGLFRSGRYEYDRTIALVLMPQMQKLMNVDDIASEICVNIADNLQPKEYSEVVAKTLQRDVPEQRFLVDDWLSKNEMAVISLRQGERTLLVILFLIVLVTITFIVSNGLALITEKIPHIAMFKTMGATDGDILCVFMGYGLFLGILGVSLGTVVGFIGCKVLSVYGLPLPDSVFYFGEYQFSIEIKSALLLAVSSILLVLFAIGYPAYKASQLKPLDGLR